MENRMILSRNIRRLLALVSCLPVFFILLAASATARDINVSPGESLQALLRGGEVAAGDSLVLQDGNYGPLSLHNVRFSAPVELRAATPNGAIFERIFINGSSNLVLRGFGVWPAQPGHGHKELVLVNKHSEDIRLVDLDIRGSRSAPDRYMDAESQQEWRDEGWGVNGVRLYGPRSSLIGSRITGVNFAITATKTHAEIRDNLVRGFSGDGIRALGNHARVIGNRVQDCVKINDNHDDGFQSWAPKDKAKDGQTREVRDLVLRDNVIIEWTGPPDAPLRCTLQGIGMFDGPYREVEIHNNVIAVSAYHGIALYGGQNSRISRNTVVTPDGRTGGHPWIYARESKNGQVKPLDVVVSGNIAMSFKGVTGKTGDNLVVKHPARYLRDPANQDFAPRPDGPLADAPVGADIR